MYIYISCIKRAKSVFFRHFRIGDFDPLSKVSPCLVPAAPSAVCLGGPLSNTRKSTPNVGTPAVDIEIRYYFLLIFYTKYENIVYPVITNILCDSYNIFVTYNVFIYSILKLYYLYYLSFLLLRSLFGFDVFSREIPSLYVFISVSSRFPVTIFLNFQVSVFPFPVRIKNEIRDIRIIIGFQTSEFIYF